MQQISRISGNGHTHSRNAPPERFQTSVLDGWPRLTFFFPLDGDHQREDSTGLIHRTDKNRGCPTRRVYAWGAVSYHQHRFSQRIKPGTTRSKAPRVNPTRRAPNSSTHLTSGPPAGLLGHYDFRSPSRRGVLSVRCKPLSPKLSFCRAFGGTIRSWITNPKL